MPVHNSDIADVFNHIADLLEIKGDNPFRIRAYRNAARTVMELPKSASQMIAEKEDLSQYPGLGEAIIEKINKLVRNERLSIVDDLEKEVPKGLSQLLEIAGLGGPRIHTLHKELNIDSIESLKKAAMEHKISELKKFGKKTEEKILAEIERVNISKQRVPLARAEQISCFLIDYLKKITGIKEVTTAGSFRRRMESVGDLDILVTHVKNCDVMERFVQFDEVERVLAQGETKTSVILRSGLQVDLRSVPPESYAAALLYFTGSKEHGIALRKIALSMGLKINEYGIFKDEKKITASTEKAIYEKLGITFIEPELRENRGEIEAAQKGSLPKLVTLKDIKGDLHTHTDYSDGHNTMEEMAEAAKKLGYEYISISDHSKRMTIAHGLDNNRLKQQLREIDALNDKLKGITILKSMETDILEDGSLDLPESLLKELDIVIGAVHSKFNLSMEKQTERMIKAMNSKYLSIIAHPTGRLCGKRDPYEVDMDKLIKEAKNCGCALEINSHPERLDINDHYCRMAKEAGVLIAISTDAHRILELNHMRYGIDVARRGWLEKKNIVNTLSLKDLKKALKK